MDGMYKDVGIDEISRIHSHHADKQMRREAEAIRERDAARARAMSRRL
jgi:hypothetical protein